MSKYIIGAFCLFLVAWVAWTVAPNEKTVYKTKPVEQGWCKLPLNIGDKGTILKGSLSGIRGLVAGKINSGTDCAYLVKIVNKDIYNGDGVAYESVNADNFVEVKL